MALAFKNQNKTKLLFGKFKAVGPAGGMHGCILFKAYTALKIMDGGLFHIKELGTGTEGTLELQKTTIHQLDTKRLSRTIFPPSEIRGQIV